MLSFKSESFVNRRISYWCFIIITGIIIIIIITIIIVVVLYVFAV